MLGKKNCQTHLDKDYSQLSLRKVSLFLSTVDVLFHSRVSRQASVYGNVGITAIYTSLELSELEHHPFDPSPGGLFT